MQTIPIQPIPAQLVSVVLAGQNCQIGISQKNPCIFVDINSNGVDVSIGVQARNAVALNPSEYAGFLGNLFLIDTQGSDDPVYTGLGSRFQLVYLTETEVATL